jgi:hypothetical protein
MASLNGKINENIPVNNSKTENDGLNATLRKTSSLKEVTKSDSGQGTVNNTQIIAKTVENTGNLVSELTEHNPQNLENSQELYNSMANIDETAKKSSGKHSNLEALDLAQPNQDIKPKKLSSKSSNIEALDLPPSTNKSQSSEVSALISGKEVNKKNLALNMPEDKPFTFTNDELIFGKDPDFAPAFLAFADTEHSTENINTLNDIRDFYKGNSNPTSAQLKDLFNDKIAPVFGVLNLTNKPALLEAMKNGSPEDVFKTMNTIVSDLKGMTADTKKRFIHSDIYKNAVLQTEGVNNELSEKKTVKTGNFSFSRELRPKPVQDQIGILSNHEKTLTNKKAELEQNLENLQKNNGSPSDIEKAESELILVTMQLDVISEKKENMIKSLMPAKPISNSNDFTNLANNLKTNMDISRNDAFNTQALGALRTLTTELNKDNVNRGQVISEAKDTIKDYAQAHPNSKKHDVAIELVNQLDKAAPAFEIKDNITRNLDTAFNRGAFNSDVEQLESFTALAKDFKSVSDNSQWSENIENTMKEKGSDLAEVLKSANRKLMSEYEEAKKQGDPDNKIPQLRKDADTIVKAFNVIQSVSPVFGDSEYSNTYDIADRIRKSTD